MDAKTVVVQAESVMVHCRQIRTALPRTHISLQEQVVRGRARGSRCEGSVTMLALIWHIMQHMHHRPWLCASEPLMAGCVHQIAVDARKTERQTEDWMMRIGRRVCVNIQGVCDCKLQISFCGLHCKVSSIDWTLIIFGVGNFHLGYLWCCFVPACLLD